MNRRRGGGRGGYNNRRRYYNRYDRRDVRRIEDIKTEDSVRVSSNGNFNLFKRLVREVLEEKEICIVSGIGYATSQCIMVCEELKEEKQIEVIKLEMKTVERKNGKKAQLLVSVKKGEGYTKNEYKGRKNNKENEEEGEGEDYETPGEETESKEEKKE